VLPSSHVDLNLAPRTESIRSSCVNSVRRSKKGMKIEPSGNGATGQTAEAWNTRQECCAVGYAVIEFVEEE
jgi:hypothetical protein